MPDYVPKQYTPRVLELRLWLDVTGPGSFSRNRIDRIVEETIEACSAAAEAAGLGVRAKGGDWCAYYPIQAGNIERPGRHHETGA